MNSELQNIDARAAAEWLAEPPGHVHGMGACGVGMAGVLAHLRRRGWTVDGCDSAPNHRADWLASQGIAVRAGHGPEHIAETVSAVVRSAATPADHPELAQARARGIPVFSRGQVLAALLTGPGSVAVCGTHGKTTTSSLLVQILRQTGLDPSWCIGGETETADGTLAAAGSGGGAPFVAEADESDGTLALYAPDMTVVGPIEFDHMEHFSGPAAFEACFRAAAERTIRRVFFSADDDGARRVVGGLPGARGFGFAADAAVRATAVADKDEGQTFTLCVDGMPVAEAQLPFPGRHNVRNALGAIAVALELGAPPDAAARALTAARLPLRRFQKYLDRPDLTIVSDYAHHPTEIAALLRMAGPRRRLVVFQPHRYTRTLRLAADFAPAFAEADTVILLPVYAASEAPLPGGAHWDLYARLRQDAEQSGWSGQMRLAMNFEQARHELTAAVRPGDILLVVGAGDVERLADWAATRFREPLSAADDGSPPPPAPLPEPGVLSPASVCRAREPLAARTTLKAGGHADLWAVVGSEADARALLAFCQREQLRWRVLGGGSNVLVGDAGVDGLVLRLAAPGFGTVRLARNSAGGHDIVCGAAVPLARLLAFLEAEELGGLEFLEGIPGTVGGALAMNAGAAGDEIGRHTLWIRFMEADGRVAHIRAADADFAYRHCGGLQGRLALEAAFRTEPSRRETIRARRETLARKRAWMRGLRSAGSLFLNPPGDKAGRLLDAAGLKGFRVGGARLSDEHANIAALERGARASDLRALMEAARTTVRHRFGIALEPEVECWERT